MCHANPFTPETPLPGGITEADRTVSLGSHPCAVTSHTSGDEATPQPHSVTLAWHMPVGSVDANAGVCPDPTRHRLPQMLWQIDKVIGYK